MKHIHKFLSLALALVLCLSLAACGDEGGRDDNDNNFYNAPNSLEGLVKDSEQMSNLYVFGGAWRGEDGETLISATSDAGDEVRFALYDADEEVTASGFIQFVPEYDYDYFYNEHDGVAYQFSADGSSVNIYSLGSFTYEMSLDEFDAQAEDYTAQWSRCRSLCSRRSRRCRRRQERAAARRPEAGIESVSFRISPFAEG